MADDAQKMPGEERPWLEIPADPHAAASAAAFAQQKAAAEEMAARVTAEASEEIERGQEPIQRLLATEQAVADERHRQEQSDRRMARISTTATVYSAAIGTVAMIVAVVALIVALSH